MRKPYFIFSLLLLLVAPFLSAQPQTGNAPAKTVFDKYLNQAQTFAEAYPREKAYLHFDNTSYYVGDTIWFKAYVTLADEPLPSPISRPLYVELVDQSGHVANKQIVKLINGEGNGQLVLPQTMMTGYYEVRAFTRWMLGFGEQQYFSRTFPIYQPSNSDNPERSITTYRLNKSMKQRPVSSDEKFMIRFFPEGGQLVEGVSSQVAFKAESIKEGGVKVSGDLYTDDGQKITAIQSLHDGMGRFEYTPSGKPAIAKVSYNNKEYEFKLPQALPNGYVLNATNQAGAITVQVSCNAATPQDTLAVFISHQGKPQAYQLISCKADAPQKFLMRTKGLPSGVLQLSLINRAGTTLCERFSFILPKAPLKIEATGLKSVYTPYAPIRCELQVTNAQDEPIQSNLSVAIRDGIRSDYQEYDNTIFTDLLLTSDLKGYIHQPGYYFADITPQKLDELDILLMVHAWRKYDMSQVIGVTPFIPLQAPEPQLVLHGQVKSTIMKNELKDIAVSVVAKIDSTILAGSTVTDDNGRFNMPVEDFENTLEVVFQTKRVGKERKKDASIMIDRNFTPPLRPYGYHESNPAWKDTEKWSQVAEATDSLYMDSLQKADDFHLLDDVVIKAKRKNSGNMRTNIREQSIDAYYDIRQSVDLIRDNGKDVFTIPELMEKLSPQFNWNRSDDKCTYKQRPILYVFDGHIMTSIEEEMMKTEVDGLQSLIICDGGNAFSDELIQNSKLSRGAGEESLDIANLDKYVIFYLIPSPGRDVFNKNQRATLGTRQTIIQGYTPPEDFYSPAYKGELPDISNDRRRTLYWNPSVKTDSNGKAVIECFNNQYSTPLIISAETMSNGVSGTVTYSTISEPEK